MCKRAWGATNWTARTSLATRSEEHTSELQSRLHLVCRLLLEKKKNDALVILVSRSMNGFAGMTRYSYTILSDLHAPLLVRGFCKCSINPRSLSYPFCYSASIL